VAHLYYQNTCYVYPTKCTPTGKKCFSPLRYEAQQAIAWGIVV
jgi:hypothetical protein